MSLVFGDFRTNTPTIGTVVATATAIVGFAVIFYALGLVALGVSAAVVATMGTADPADTLQLSLANGGLALGGGIAAANFLVALLVLSMTSRLFVGAQPRLTALTFAAGYTALAGSITLMTDVNLGWSVAGVLAACLIRFVSLSASPVR